MAQLRRRPRLCDFSLRPRLSGSYFDRQNRQDQYRYRKLHNANPNGGYGRVEPSFAPRNNSFKSTDRQFDGNPTISFGIFVRFDTNPRIESGLAERNVRPE